MEKEIKKQPSFTIYKAENLSNGEVYIGATTQTLQQRKLDHLERAKRQEPNKFHEAIGTYGPGAFSWTTIDTANTVNELAEKEKQYIVEYNARENGYNSDSGGGFKKKVFQYSVTDKKLIQVYDSLKNAANAINASVKSISKACLSVNKRYGGYYWSYGNPLKLSSDKRKKQVEQYRADGTVLATYPSVAEASKATGISKSCIARFCRGDRKPPKGNRWRYKQ